MIAETLRDVDALIWLLCTTFSIWKTAEYFLQQNVLYLLCKSSDMQRKFVSHE